MKTAVKRLMIYVLVALLVFQGSMPAAYAQIINDDLTEQVSPEQSPGETIEPEVTPNPSPQDTIDTSINPEDDPQINNEEDAIVEVEEAVLPQEETRTESDALSEEMSEADLLEAEEKEIRFHTNVSFTGSSQSLTYSVYHADGRLVQSGLTTAYDNPYVVLEPGEYYLTISADQLIKNGILYDQFFSYSRDNYDSDKPTQVVNGDLSNGSFDSEGNFKLNFTAARGSWNTTTSHSYHRTFAWIEFRASATRKITVTPKSNDYQTEKIIRDSLVTTYTDGSREFTGGTTTVVPQGDFQVSFGGIPEGMQAEAYIGTKRLAEGDLNTDANQMIHLYVRPAGLPMLPDDLTNYKMTTLTLNVKGVSDVRVDLASEGVSLTPTQLAANKFQQVIDQRPYTVTLDGLPAGYQIASVTQGTTPINYDLTNRNSFSFTPQFTSIFQTITIELEESPSVTASFSFNRELDETVALPEPITVQPGETITLPEVERDVTSKYSFLGWYYSTDTNKTLHQPGETVVLEEDTQFVGFWEGNYGKAHVMFHTGPYSGDGWQNKTHVGVSDLTGFGARVIGTDETAYDLKAAGDNYPGSMTYSGLAKGEYRVEIEVPEGYRVISVKSPISGEVVDIDLETETFSIPWYKFNMTLGPAYYVEVEAIEKATVTFDGAGGTFKEDAETTLQVEVGDEIILPYDFNLGLKKPGQVFKGWLVEGTEEIYQPRASYTVMEDTTFVAQWEDVQGQLILFVVDKNLSDQLPEPYLVDAEGNEYELTSNSYTNRERWWRTEVESLLNGSYSLKFRGLEDGQTIVLEDAAPSLRSKVEISQNEAGEDVLTFTFDENTPRSSRFVKVRAQVIDPVTASFSFNRELNETVTLPEPITVKPGETITLPEVAQDVTAKYSFLGWYYSTDTAYNKTLLQPGETVVLEGDTQFVGLWEGNYGKAHVMFHTGVYSGDGWQNKTHVGVSDLTGFGARVIGTDETAYDLKAAGVNYPGSMTYSGLAKGEYRVEIEVPEGYRVISVKSPISGEVVDIDLATETFSIPWYKFNMTLGPAYYVEVEEIELVTASFSFNRELDETVTLPEPITVKPGETITLPEVAQDVTAKYSFLGWYYSTDTAYNKTLLQPGETVVLEGDTQFVGLWEGNNGKVNLQFHTEEFTGDSWNRTHVGVENLDGFEARVIRQDGTSYELVPRGEGYSGRMQYTKLSKGEYTIEIGIPEGYRVVAINGWFSSEIVPIDLENDTFSIPWFNNNMTMGPAYFVQVESASHTVTYQMDDKTTTEQVLYGEQPIEVPAVPSKHYHTVWIDFLGWQDEAGEMIDPATVTITADRTFRAVMVDKSQLKMIKNGYSNISNATNPEILDDVLAKIDQSLNDPTKTQAEVDALIEEFNQLKQQLILGHRFVISPRDENGKLIPRAHVILEVVRVAPSNQGMRLMSQTLQAEEVVMTLDTSTMTPTGTGSYNTPVLPNGDYIIRELKAPEGYQLVDDVPMTIVVSQPTGYTATFWKPNHQPLVLLNLSYEAGEGSFGDGAQTTIEVAAGTEVKLATPEELELTREGYTFTGWMLQGSEPAVIYSAGDTFLMEEDTVMIAQWEADEEPTDPDDETVETPTEPETDPEETPTDPDDELVETPTEPEKDPVETPTEPGSGKDKGDDSAGKKTEGSKPSLPSTGAGTSFGILLFALVMFLLSGRLLRQQVR